MVRGAEYRRRKYDGKIDPDVIAGRFERLATHIRHGMADKIPSLVEIEEQIKILCAQYGIASILIPFYMNVGRELFRVRIKHVGATASAEAQLVANKWATRGLNTSLIREICLKFGFDITPVSWY